MGEEGVEGGGEATLDRIPRLLGMGGNPGDRGGEETHRPPPPFGKKTMGAPPPPPARAGTTPTPTPPAPRRPRTGSLDVWKG
jgi:hypothetical protein